MQIKYGVVISEDVISKKLGIFIDQIYKLLPLREESKDWEKSLDKILLQLTGMFRLMECGNSLNTLSLLSKLEGLYLLKEEEQFQSYRKTIFDCINLINIMQKDLCLLKTQKKE